jgi:hypothetical protein
MIDRTAKDRMAFLVATFRARFEFAEPLLIENFPSPHFPA